MEDSISNVLPSEKQGKYYLSWNSYLENVFILKDILSKNIDKYNSFYGIPRGGLFIALYMSYQFNKPLIDNIDNITDKTLILDDICDSGKTFLDLGLDNDLAVLHYRSISKHRPTYFVKRIDNDDWIVYPYEKRD